MWAEVPTGSLIGDLWVGPHLLVPLAILSTPVCISASLREGSKNTGFCCAHMLSRWCACVCVLHASQVTVSLAQPWPEVSCWACLREAARLGCRVMWRGVRVGEQRRPQFTGMACAEAQRRHLRAGLGDLETVRAVPVPRRPKFGPCGPSIRVGHPVWKGRLNPLFPPGNSQGASQLACECRGSSAHSVSLSQGPGRCVFLHVHFRTLPRGGIGRQAGVFLGGCLSPLQWGLGCPLCPVSQQLAPGELSVSVDCD